MTPLDIAVTEEGKPAGQFHMQIVNDRLLSPYLLQMAVFSALDSTARATGVLSVAMDGSVEFENRADSVRIHNIYATDGGAVNQHRPECRDNAVLCNAGRLQQPAVKANLTAPGDFLAQTRTHHRPGLSFETRSQAGRHG